MRHAVVIGAGIGGLTAALALRRRQWTVEIIERADRLDDAGSGLGISPNALRALDTIGVGDAVRELAAFTGSAGIRRFDGRWLSRVDLTDLTRRFGDPVLALSRPHLVRLLADRLGDIRLLLGTTVHDADPRTGRVSTEHGDTDADLVVAADGIHSRVRRVLFPRHPQPVYSGVTTWRTLVPTPAHPVTPAEHWGRGAILATIPVSDERVYLYAAAAADAGVRGADERAELIRRFGGWVDPIPELLCSADPGAILRHDVHHLATALPRFHDGRIALLGDAAHPMTPNLGQGACQAIEDAVVLAAQLGTGAGLAGYSRARLPRTTDIARRSARVTRLTKWRNPVATTVRDTGLRIAGAFGPGAAVRQVAPVYDWRPPTD